MLELHSLHSLLNISRMVKSVELLRTEHINKIKETFGAFNILTGKTTVKRSLGKSRHKL